MDFGLLEHTWEVEKKFGEGHHPYMNWPGTPSAGREIANGLDHSSRNQWLEQKIRAPRSYDRGRDKAPLDIWRMPNFGLNESDIHAIATYVLGLVKEGDVASSRMMHLNPEQKALDDGWHAIRMNNCVGCHPFGMEQVDFNVEAAAGSGAPPTLAAARGLITVDEKGEDSISMQLWEPCPDMNIEAPEDTKISSIATIERKQIVPQRPMEGGGIWPSLTAYYQEKENKGITEALPLIPPVLAREGEKIRLPWLFDS